MKLAGARLWTDFRTMVVLVGLLWLIEIGDQVWQRMPGGHTLDMLGVKPRDAWGLMGILFAPFVHHGFGHLLSNSVPLIILGWLMLVGGRWLFVRATAVIMVVSGLGTWLLGTPDSVHLGASGLIYGWLAFLLVRGFLEMSVRWVVVSVAIGVLYAWNFTLFQFDAKTSTSAHLFGFFGGLLAAWIFFYLPKRRAGFALPGLGSSGKSDAMSKSN